MARIGDTTPIKLQLKLTNYAESLDESKPRHHVRRISFVITILEDECRADDILVDYSTPLSADDKKLLKWQARNLEDDVEVRNELTSMSGRLCPYKSIGMSLYDKVTDHDTHQQTIGRRPLSSYRHVSFRSAMLTKHSEPDGDIQLLFLDDGLPGDRSCLRWRSHDYIKLVFPEARPSTYRVFWLVQWDVVDMSDPIHDVGHDARLTGSPVTGRGINWRPQVLDHSTASDQRHGDVSGKFHGIRCRKKRKSSWTAEVRPKGLRRKIYLGSYESRDAAARAVDAGHIYYDLNRLNFRDSPWFLENIPVGLGDKEKEAFVKEQAHRLVSLTSSPSPKVQVLTSASPLASPSTWIPQSRPYNNTNTNRSFTSSGQPYWNTDSGNNYESGNMQPATNANFAALPRSYGFNETQSMDSARDLETILDLRRPSNSFDSNVRLEEIVGSSPDKNLWLSTSNDIFITTDSRVSAAVYHSLLERPGYICSPSLSPVSNCTSGEATNDVFNVFTRPTGWDGNSAEPVQDISDMIAESVQAEPSGDYGRDVDLYPGWLC